MLELFHTSFGEIEKIDDSGLFGSFLFFSSDVYFTGGDTKYKMEISEDDIIAACTLFNHDNSTCAAVEAIVSEVEERFDIDWDTATDLLSERISGFDEIDGFDGEDSWYMQHCTARIARALGFRGVCVTDEQGSAYMIDMKGRENDLVKID